MYSAIEFCIFELIYLPNFILIWRFWVFGPSFPKKDISSEKQKKWTSQLSSAYSNQSWCQISAYTGKLFFWPKFRKKGISGRKRKKALVRTSMIVTYYIELFITYYIKLFRTGTDRHNVILMTLLLLVAETKSWNSKFKLERGI